MNFEANDLLEMVDEWKFKLHDKLRNLTEQQQAAFWKRSLERARAAGLPIAEVAAPAKHTGRQRRRATG